jgi:hypothetical protein
MSAAAAAACCRASLRECEADDDMARLVPDIKGADPMAAALLIECRWARLLYYLSKSLHVDLCL